MQGAGRAPGYPAGLPPERSEAVLVSAFCNAWNRQRNAPSGIRVILSREGGSDKLYARDIVVHPCSVQRFPEQYTFVQPLEEPAVVNDVAIYR